MNSRFISARAAVILLVVGIVSSIALLVLVAFAPDLETQTSNGTDALSRSAVGFAGLEKLIGLSGMPVEIDRGTSTSHPSLTIVTPTAATNPRDVGQYHAAGPLLIILPKWTTAPEPLRSDRVQKTGVIGRAAGLSSAMMLYFAPGNGDVTFVPGSMAMPGLPQRLNMPVEELQMINCCGDALLSITSSNRYIARRTNGVPVLVRKPGGTSPVYVLSEPDLMNNHGLADQSTAIAALAIIRALRQGDGPVLMDVTLDGLGSTPSLLRALFEPPLRGGTICALMAGLLMALHALARFGAPQAAARVFARGKKSLAENTARLVHMMGREAGMAARYARSARAIVIERLGATRDSPAEQEALLAAIERKAGLEGRYAGLAQEAAWAKNGNDLIVIASRLHAWRERISSGH